jgi:predicted metal-dependent hydrolase
MTVKMKSSEEARQRNFQRGVQLFNAGDFFQAHEALEDAWRETNGDERLFVQGLVQVAVALHHFRGGNMAGAHGVLRRALRNLESYPPHYAGVDVTALRRELEPILKCAAAGESSSENLPRIVCVEVR